jgi:glycosyltransferase involved in cell wall biosynthesis
MNLTVEPQDGATPEPLVSVIVPAFNAASTIAATLESVLAQTHSNLEVLVIDDGSTDSTISVVQSMARKDPRIRLLRQPNQGVAAARNQGIEQATGEFLAPVDADDLWRSDKIEKQVGRIRMSGPDTVLVYTWHAKVDASGHLIRPLAARPADRGRVTKPLIIWNIVGNGSAPLMRRAAVREVGGYDPSLLARSGGQGNEDWKLYLELAMRHDFDVVPEYLTGYRETAGSMSRRIRPFLANFNAMSRDIRQVHADLPTSLFTWSELVLLVWIARNAFFHGDFRAASLATGFAVRLALLRHPGLLFTPAARAFVSYMWRTGLHHRRRYDGGPFLEASLEPEPGRERVSDAMHRFVSAALRCD